MTWKQTIVKMVRYLIGDIDETSYSSARLQEAIVTSAQLMLSEVEFDVTYTISVTGVTISPDPTIEPDNDFINLVSLKTAALIVGSEAKTLAGQAYKITDGPSTIDVTLAYKAKKEMYSTLLDNYNSAVTNYTAGNGTGGLAIFSSMTVYNETPYNFN